MRLFHFCADHHLDAILREGLTRGMVAWMGPTGPLVHRGIQWLTDDESQERQEWCNPKFSSLPYDRAANRLTIEISEDDKQLRRWEIVGQLLVPVDVFELLGSYGVRDHAWIYFGSIDPECIVTVDRLGARWGTLWTPPTDRDTTPPSAHPPGTSEEPTGD